MNFELTAWGKLIRVKFALEVIPSGQTVHKSVLFRLWQARALAVAVDHRPPHGFPGKTKFLK